MMLNVNGREVEVIGYAAYLYDFEKNVGTEKLNGTKVKDDPEKILIDAIEGCLEYNIGKGEGCSFSKGDYEFGFECVEEGEIYMVEYCGCRNIMS